MHILKFQTPSLTVQINGITRNRLRCFRTARKHNHCVLLIVGLFVLITISAAKKNIPGASCGQYHCQCGMRNGPTLQRGSKPRLMVVGYYCLENALIIVVCFFK